MQPGHLKRKFNGLVGKYATPSNFKKAKGMLNTARNVKKIWNKYKSQRKSNKSNRKSRGKKRDTFVQKQDHNIGSSESKCHLKYKAMPIARTYKKLANHSVYETVTASSLGHGTGADSNRQAYALIDTLYTSTDVSAIALKAFTNLLPANALSTNSAPGGAQSVYKMLLSRVVTEMEIVNQTGDLTTIQIYNLVSKTTTGTAVSPITAWENGLQEEMGAGGATSFFPGNKPTSSKEFNIAWKIVGCKSVEMLPGKVHRHKFVFTPNRIVDFNYFQNYQYVKGITCYTLVVAKGSPTDTSKTFGLPSNANINLSPVKLIYSIRHRYVTKILSVLPANTYQLNSFTPSTVGTTAMYTWDQEAGTVVNMDDATVAAA